MPRKQQLPAAKEWPNSVYGFNKANTKDFPIKDLMADRLIKNFFYLIKKSNYKARSRRMSHLLTKSKTNRLYLSTPEIKQTNDKATVTVYNYDREREFLIKKFFYYKRLIKSVSKAPLKVKNRLLNKRFLLKVLPLSGRKLDIEVKSYEKKLSNKINSFKANKTKDLFFRYLFLRWILSSLGIRINFVIPKTGTSKFLLMTSNKPFTQNQKHFLINAGFVYKNEKSIKVLFRNTARTKEGLGSMHNYVIGSSSLPLLKDKIEFLYGLLERQLPIKGVEFIYKIGLYYKWYRARYYKRYLKIFLLRKIRFNRIRTFHMNSIRFSKYLPLLKLFMNKIYNKKVELNLINLKYPYLSSDIFVNSLATKLRDRTRSLAVVVKNYLRMIKLVKLPLQLRERSKASSGLLNKLSKGKDLGLNNITDFSKIKSKWVTGMRLEASGRLTNRFVAQRSVYKYRYKGNLKSTEYRPVNIRSYVKPNIQKSYVQSIRRIGAFGLKGWISSN